MAFGLGAVFVGVQSGANAGGPTDKAGLAAALISTSSTLSGALGPGDIQCDRRQPVVERVAG